MNIVDLIVAKRDDHQLDDESIRWFIRSFAADQVPDHQSTALLMAIVLRGLDERELATWTAAMIDSGERIDLSAVSRPIVDKHSTGGVGDKVSLVLCPLVAACGAAVPQVSGRGLGHTGGTLDKLEAIPGWSGQLAPARALRQLDEVGTFIAAAGPGLAPADRRMYALRDVTGTVASIPLIASSIMSKKIASGTPALVLDVKVGSAAFLPDPDQVRLLARTMIELGEANGVRTRALLTDMDSPLGAAAGNGLEVTEAVECLAGGGPPDLRELTLALATEMLDLAGLDADPAATLDSGRAMDRWRAMISAQGGDPDARLDTAKHLDTLTADRSGVVQRVDALTVGRVVWQLGAGREDHGDSVSPTAGVVTRSKPGDRVEAGDTLFEVHADTAEAMATALEALPAATTIRADDVTRPPLVRDRLTA